MLMLMLMHPSISACDSRPYAVTDIRLRQRRDPQLLLLILYIEKKEPYTMNVPASIAEDKFSKFVLDEDDILYKMHTPAKPYDTEIF